MPGDQCTQPLSGPSHMCSLSSSFAPILGHITYYRPDQFPKIKPGKFASNSSSGEIVPDVNIMVLGFNFFNFLNYKAALRSIHTSSVQQTIQNQDHNRVLGIPAPAIDPSERTLPRRTRTLLSQLRSGHSTGMRGGRLWRGWPGACARREH